MTSQPKKNTAIEPVEINQPMTIAKPFDIGRDALFVEQTRNGPVLARTRIFRKLTVTNRLRNSLPRCTAMTAQGKRCAMVAAHDGLCRYHHPALAAETHKNNRIGTRRYWAARRLAKSVGGRRIGATRNDEPASSRSRRSVHFKRPAAR